LQLSGITNPECFIDSSPAFGEICNVNNYFVIAGLRMYVDNACFIPGFCFLCGFSGISCFIDLFSIEENTP